MLPCIETYQKVDLRTITLDVPPQEVSTVQYSTVQYSTAQYSTVQYSTAQYSIVQHSMVADLLTPALQCTSTLLCRPVSASWRNSLHSDTAGMVQEVMYNSPWSWWPPLSILCSGVSSSSTLRSTTRQLHCSLSMLMPAPTLRTWVIWCCLQRGGQGQHGRHAAA